MKKKLCLLLALIIGGVLVLSGCGSKEVVDGTDDLRTDGVYQTADEDLADQDFFKFFKDGKVHFERDDKGMQADEAFRKLTKSSFEDNNPGKTSNSFTVKKSNEIEFTFGTNNEKTYSLTIDGDTLKGKVTKQDGNVYEREYKFVEVNED